MLRTFGMELSSIMEYGKQVSAVEVSGSQHKSGTTAPCGVGFGIEMPCRLVCYSYSKLGVLWPERLSALYKLQ